VSGCSESDAFHWYSGVVPTVIELRVAVVEWAVHDSVPTAPHLTVPVVADWSVAQLTIADELTTSVRYG
jgi:hypothetical protein